MFYGPGISCHFADDEAYVHAIRVPGDATDAADLTRAEMQGRRDAWTMFRTWKKNVPGFEDSYFVTCGPYIGGRETRWLIGQYVLTKNDIRECRRLDDAIATGLLVHGPPSEPDHHRHGECRRRWPSARSLRHPLPCDRRPRGREPAGRRAVGALPPALPGRESRRGPSRPAGYPGECIPTRQSPRRRAFPSTRSPLPPTRRRPGRRTWRERLACSGASAVAVISSGARSRRPTV